MFKKGILILDDKFEEIIVVILCCLLVFSLTYTVVVRYAFHTPFLSSISHLAEELATFSFIWLLYFGAILATKNGQHFSITVQFKLLPKKIQRFAFIPGYLGWILFNLVIVKLGMELAEFTTEESMALEIPMKFVYSIIPLSFILITLRLVQHSYRILRSNPNAENDDA